MERSSVNHAVNFKESGWICIGCGGTSAEPFILNGPDRMQISTRRYTLYRCQNCHTIFLYPQTTLEEQTAAYDCNYAPYQPSLRRGMIPTALFWRGVNKQVQAMQKFMGREAEERRVLDIGCGGGDFLHGMQQMGWQVEGVELSPEISAIAQDKYKIPIHVGSFLSLPLPENTFDLVTFWDVLEHLENPRDAIRKARTLLKPGGSLVFSLPDPNSFETGLFGKSWAGWDIPRHLWIFPQAVWTQILQEEGWEIINVRHMRGRIWLFRLSLDWWIQDQPHISMWHKLLRSLVKSPFSVPALWPYFEFVEKKGRGSIMVFFAHKR